MKNNMSTVQSENFKNGPVASDLRVVNTRAALMVEIGDQLIGDRLQSQRSRTTGHRGRDLRGKMKHCLCRHLLDF